VFVQQDLVDYELAERLRDDLQIAKVKRAELYGSTEHRRQLRVHDLRGTFVTLNLAAGKLKRGSQTAPAIRPRR
jgi:hypothetical protein